MFEDHGHLESCNVSDVFAPDHLSKIVRLISF